MTPTRPYRMTPDERRIVRWLRREEKYQGAASPALGQTILWIALKIKCGEHRPKGGKRHGR